jgi:hypothetical protein
MKLMYISCLYLLRQAISLSPAHAMLSIAPARLNQACLFIQISNQYRTEWIKLGIVIQRWLAEFVIQTNLISF